MGCPILLYDGLYAKKARECSSFALPLVMIAVDFLWRLSRSYRGDIVNGLEFTPASRANDPYRMLSAYHQSAQVSGQLGGESAVT